MVMDVSNKIQRSNREVHDEHNQILLNQNKANFNHTLPGTIVFYSASSVRSTSSTGGICRRLFIYLPSFKGKPLLHRPLQVHGVRNPAVHPIILMMSIL